MVDSLSGVEAGAKAGERGDVRQIINAAGTPPPRAAAEVPGPVSRRSSTDRQEVPGRGSRPGQVRRSRLATPRGRVIFLARPNDDGIRLAGGWCALAPCRRFPYPRLYSRFYRPFGSEVVTNRTRSPIHPWYWSASRSVRRAPEPFLRWLLSRSCSVSQPKRVEPNCRLSTSSPGTRRPRQ